MSEISDWIQSNWFELGSILVQVAVLATLAWYGRKALKILMASYDEMEAMRSLWVSKLAPEQPVAQPAFAVPGFEHAGFDSGGVAAAWRDLITWLRAPMGSGGIGPCRRVLRWFQAPMGS
jgi:hypothetical protein